MRWPLALGSLTWFLAFSWDEPPGVLLAAPLVLLGLVQLPRRTRLGSALVLAAGFVTLAAGGSWGNLDMVAPLAVVLFAVGRAAPLWADGVAVVLLGSLGNAMREGLTLYRLTITCVLFGTVWGFGVVVRRRALRAHAAVSRATLLARQDPALAGARLAVEERTRLAEAAIFALRSAVVGMRARAREASGGLDAALVREVHESGTVAVDVLRELLGLLREPTKELPEPVAADDDRTARVWERMGRAAPFACLALSALTVLLALNPPEVPESLFPVAATYLVVAWAIATQPSRAGWACVAVLAGTGAWLGTTYGPRGTGFILFVIGAAVVMGLTWSERDRILRDAQQRTGRLQARLDEATARAVRAERLRLARELHDVASHSVGAMVMQAGAARALRSRDPQAAREALRTVVSTGDRALRDVDEMLATLDAGEFGRVTRAYARPGRLREALDALVAQMRADGMTLRVTFEALPTSPALTATTFRIVQESLVNAQRHAPGQEVDVMAQRQDEHYVVRVTNGPALGSPHALGAGFGLAGLRERVHACDGTFTAGPTSGGGFEVEARLPLDDSTDRSAP